MKISLKDIGNFAVGAIERDKELTKESLENRKEELKATRAILIAQKAKRYEKDIAKFEEEDKKYKAIEAVNKQFTGKTDVDRAEWGKLYLQNYKPEQYATILKAYGENTSGLNEYLKGFAVNKDFKTFSTEKAIDTKYQDEVKSIMTDTTKQIKDARGDSFLINQILGNRDKKISEAESIKTESATGIEQAKKVNTEVANIETKPEEEVSFTFSKEDKAKTIFVPKSFKDEAQKLRTKLNENTEIKKENINIGLTFFTENNIPVSDQYLTKDKDGNVTGLKGAGRTFINQTNLLSSQAIKDFTNENLYLGTGKEASLISNKLNPNVIYRLTAERLADYSIATAEKNFFTKRDNMVAIVPFSVVSTDNILAGKYQFTNKAQTKLVGQAYLDVIKDITNEQNPNASIESKQKFMNDLQNKLLSADITTDNKLVMDVQNKIINKLQLGTSKTTEPASTSPGVESIVYQGKRIPLTDANKKALTGMNFDWQNAPKVTAPNITPSKTNTSNEFDDFGDAPFIPQRTRGEMSMAERRVYDKKQRDEQMKLMEDRRKSFNTKVRNINQQSSNTNTIDFNADK
jgi:hypothetical protein